MTRILPSILTVALTAITAHAGTASKAAATPAKLEPKRVPPLPPKVQEIANQLFEAANLASKDNKIDVAIAKYRELQRLAPHPFINFNIAMLLEEQGKYSDAIEQYQAYLPTAVGKEATSLAARIQLLGATPAPVIGVAKSNYKVKSLWLVDGVVVGRDAATFDVSPGSHKIENISELGYWFDRLRTKPGPKGGHRYELSVDERKDGNVILSAEAGDNYGWFYAIDGSDRDDALGKGVHHSGRYTLTPGKHTLLIKDSVCNYPTEIDVKKDQLTYFYFTRVGFDHRALLADMGPSKPACGKIVVKPMVINFDAPNAAPKNK
jgi:hypothetical protein